jgi:hypothetical protein
MFTPFVASRITRIFNPSLNYEENHTSDCFKNDREGGCRYLRSHGFARISIGFGKAHRTE